MNSAWEPGTPAMLGCDRTMEIDKPLQHGIDRHFCEKASKPLHLSRHEWVSLANLNALFHACRLAATFFFNAIDSSVPYFRTLRSWKTGWRSESIVSMYWCGQERPSDPVR